MINSSAPIQKGSATLATSEAESISSNELWLKRGIWLYFVLLIFEGALRKWILPGLAEPLLVIRDPVAIWLIIKSIGSNFWRPNIYVIAMWGITVFSLVLTFLIGHGNLVVAMYGLRITAIHFPLMFVIGSLFSKSDVLQLGKILLWITIAMTFLVAVQFYSPQSAWVNIGVGGDLSGSGFSGAGGFFRVPGTFSFTNGLSLFYGVSAAFICCFWISQSAQQVNRGLLFASTLALLVAVPLSISRTVLFEIMLSFLFLLFIIGQKPKIIKSIIAFALGGMLLFICLSSFSFFQTATITFSDRFTSASNVEGGLEGTLIERFLGGMYGAVTKSDSSFTGLGLGIGTNAGAQIMTGKRAFLVSEGEWGRVIGEMGFILGFLVIIIRGSLVVKLLKMGWNAVKDGNFLPWMLMSFGALVILQGQWAQPTALGFSTLTGGLAIAALKGD